MKTKGNGGETRRKDAEKKVKEKKRRREKKRNKEDNRRRLIYNVFSEKLGLPQPRHAACAAVWAAVIL